jgi:hypothetical protein
MQELVGSRLDAVTGYDILKHGSSADEQLRVYADARVADRGRHQALKDVVDWLQRETAE